MPTLKTYNPHWEAEYVALHAKMRAQWLAASAQKDPEKRQELTGECRNTFNAMKAVRLRKYETPADFACRVLNHIAFDARRQGVFDMWQYLPDPGTFKTLEQVRALAKKRKLLPGWTKKNKDIVHDLMCEFGVSPRPQEATPFNMGVMPIGRTELLPEMRPV